MTLGIHVQAKKSIVHLAIGMPLWSFGIHRRCCIYKILDRGKIDTLAHKYMTASFPGMATYISIKVAEIK
jgi:hypothetical protein